MNIRAILIIAITLALGFSLSACGRKPTVSSHPVQLKTSELPPPPLPPIPSAPRIPGRAFVLMDAASGYSIAASNDTAPLEPASLTKIMTAYAVFDAMRSGSLKSDDLVTISEHAWRVGGAVSEGSTTFLPVHSQAPVQVLLQGMIVQSGNDASIALAERIGGSEEAFAQLMNSYAARLGMTATHFENSTGLPGPHHVTTARDMAVLARAIIRDFPQYYPLFSEKQYTYNGITQHNRNGLLERDPSVDGLKTGHTESSGYSLVTSAKRNDMRLIAVVLGTKSFKEREDANAALLNYGFTFFESKAFVKVGDALATVRVWKGLQKEVKVAPTSEVILTMPRGRAPLVQTKLEVPESAVAPLTHTAPLGKVSYLLDGKEIAAVPLYPQEDVGEAGFFSRMMDSVRMRFE
jgi:D-alanyl-D-alanine carboxypeptidase (penicillin-binding protein 5/6)